MGRTVTSFGEVKRLEINNKFFEERTSAREGDGEDLDATIVNFHTGYATPDTIENLKDLFARSKKVMMIWHDPQNCELLVQEFIKIPWKSRFNSSLSDQQSVFDTPSQYNDVFIIPHPMKEYQEKQNKSGIAQGSDISLITFGFCFLTRVLTDYYLS